MNTRYYYVGVFFDPYELDNALAPIRRQRLDRTIPFPHVTFAYMPSAINRGLFGERVEADVTGYGNDGQNEGVRVVLTSQNPDIQRMIQDIPIPHITLSICHRAEPVNTKFLSFQPIEPIRITGRFGGYAERGRIDCGEAY